MGVGGGVHTILSHTTSGDPQGFELLETERYVFNNKIRAVCVCVCVERINYMQTWGRVCNGQWGGCAGRGGGEDKW